MTLSSLRSQSDVDSEAKEPGNPGESLLHQTATAVGEGEDRADGGGAGRKESLTVHQTPQLIKKYFGGQLGEDDEEENHDLATRARWLNNAMAVVIVLNCLQLGAECQWPRDSASTLLSTLYLRLDYAFCVVYMGEVCLKIRVKGCNWYFCGKLMHWNIFDITLTVTMIVDVWFHSIGSGNLATGINALRVVRMFRLVRFFQVFTEVPELTVVVEGLARSVKTLAWIFGVLVMLIYATAIFFHFFASDLFEGQDGEVGFFDDLVASMMTLADVVVFQTWAEILHPIARERPYLIFPFFAFVLIAGFGVVNIIVGVIVDATADTKTRLEQKKLRAQLLAQGLTWEKEIHQAGLSQARIAQETDERLKAEEIKMRKKKIEEIMENLIKNGSVEFPAGLTAHELECAIDKDGNGEVSHEEFVVGVGRFLLGSTFQQALSLLVAQGKLRIQAHGISQQLEVVSERQREENCAILDRLNEVSERLQRIEAKLDKAEGADSLTQ